MNSRTRWRGDDGFAAVELPIAVTAMILVMLLMVGGIRVTNMRGDVQSAAYSGARAAAAERNAGSATSAARRVVSASLADSGVGCGSPGVSVAGDFAGGSVTVTVTCTVSLSDVTLAGFPGSTTVTASGTSSTETLRAAP